MPRITLRDQSVSHPKEICEEPLTRRCGSPPRTCQGVPDGAETLAIALGATVERPVVPLRARLSTHIFPPWVGTALELPTTKILTRLQPQPSNDYDLFFTCLILPVALTKPSLHTLFELVLGFPTPSITPCGYGICGVLLAHDDRRDTALS